MPVHACACMRVCMPVHACACLCMRVHACACVCMPAHACACLCMPGTCMPVHACHLYADLADAPADWRGGAAVDARGMHRM